MIIYKGDKFVAFFVNDHCRIDGAVVSLLDALPYYLLYQHFALLISDCFRTANVFFIY